MGVDTKVRQRYSRLWLLQGGQYWVDEKTQDPQDEKWVELAVVHAVEQQAQGKPALRRR